MPAPIRVELLPHSPSWADAARAEALRLNKAFGDSILVVHHIGSTAIPGIHAKPVIDLMPVVPNVAALDDQESAFAQLGYRYWGEYGIAGRRYCTFDDPATGERTLQLHCYEHNNDEVERHLAFRDYLRAHSAIANEYDEEKHRCRELHAHDSHAYTNAKSGWIVAHLPAALAHYRSSR